MLVLQVIVGFDGTISEDDLMMFENRPEVSRVVYAAVTPPNRAVEVAVVPRELERLGGAEETHQARISKLDIQKYQVIVQSIL